MPKEPRRGFDENDKRWFSKNELSRLIKVKEEVEWLINREFKLKDIRIQKATIY